jgi:hypothetical protein
MSIILADRVKETTSTTGTGSLTLAGAETNFQSFSSGLTSGDQTYYTIVDATNTAWETGIGTFTSPSTLSRDTILASSNSGSAVNLGSGTKEVFITIPAASAGFVGVQGPMLTDATMNASTTYTQKNVFGVPEFNFGGFTRATTGITVPYDGIYELYANCYFVSNDQRPNVGIKFAIDGTQRGEVSASDYIRNSGGHDEASTNLKVVVEMTAGEEVNLFVARLADVATITLQASESVYTVIKVD